MVTKKAKKAPFKAVLARERVILYASDQVRQFYEQSRYGYLLEDGRVQLSLIEALYLLEKELIVIKEGRKKVKKEDFVKQASKAEKKFWVRYCVFKNMRDRGYIVKTALKFGADFRVYDRGVKPGEDHARWVLYPVHETETLTWYEFTAKNRVAHSTKKKLMIAIVDDEGDCTFYECRWVRP